MANSKTTHNTLTGVLDTHELAWAAGFFDGEGTCQTVKKNPPRRNTYRAMVQVAQAGSPDLLYRMQAAVGGLGSVCGPYDYKGGRLPVYRWSVSNFEGVQQVACGMWKWLGEPKRAQFRKAILSVTERVS